jgi:hypothetical protein
VIILTLQKFRKEKSTKIHFSSRAVGTLTGIHPSDHDDGYMGLGLQEEAGKKFGEFFIHPVHCVSGLYNPKTLISELTEEHNMQKSDAEQLVNQLIKGGEIETTDSILRLIKFSSDDTDPYPSSLYQLFKTTKK